MKILGISAHYHDSAAALIQDGKGICAVEEERFSRIKHDNQFPFQAIEHCLKSNNLTISDIDYIVYYEKPLLKFERILETFVHTYPFSIKPFLKGIPEWLDYKIKIEQTIRNKLQFKKQILFSTHHLSHASASFYPSPFKRSAILTIDGVGEYETTSLWMGEKNKIIPLKSIHFPHSLGLLYSTFTAFLGFKVNEDEYKLMGLAAYGKPTYIEKVRKLIDIKTDGSFQLDMKFFSFRQEFQMWNKKFEKLFGFPRNAKDIITPRHKNIAASIQSVTEEVYFKILNHLYDITKSENVCLSGGVALNALANGKIYSKTPFKNVYIFGAAGDSGNAIGAGLLAYKLNKKPNNTSTKKTIETLYLGTSYTNTSIEKVLKTYQLKYEKNENEKTLLHKTATLLAKNKIIGWFQGRMEFGPRALGSRSILANPQPRFMKELVNKIKIREQFRPFAGSILQNHVFDYLEVPKKNHWSPYMTFCFIVRSNKRSSLQAIVHKDNTCRIQTVNKKNGRYYRLISEFFKITKIPCVLNTSFNLKGEPIVENPQQAIEDFLKTKMDYLVIGDYIVSKSPIS